MSLSGWWLADKVLQSAVAYGSLQCSWDTELWKDVHSIGKVLFFGLGRVYELPQLSINCRQTKKKIQIKKLPYSRFVAGWAGLSVPFIPDDQPKIPELYWAPHLGNSCVNPLIIKLYRGQRCKKGFFFFYNKFTDLSIVMQLIHGVVRSLGTRTCWFCWAPLWSCTLTQPMIVMHGSF